MSQDQDKGAESPVFVIGLAIAGAISAGAYSAGVLDTLLRALAAHQARFDAGETGHRVVLKVISGASAGSVCAALGTVSLVAEEGADAGSARGSRLYDLWVNRLRLTAPDDAPRAPNDSFLTLDDLTEDAPVRSVLNARHIDRNADEVMSDVGVPPVPKRLDYVAEKLDLFLTTTNLMGVPYAVHFNQDDMKTGHQMSNHAAVTHFRLGGVGTADIGSHWLDSWQDEGIALSASQAQDGVLPFDDPRSAWSVLRDTAIASAAFPIGFASRPLSMRPQDIRTRAWPIDANPEMRPRPQIGEDLDAVPYIAVDGGVANNEPFELARFTLRAPLYHDERLKDSESAQVAFEEPWQLASNPRSAEDACRAVIMIDAFPEGPGLSLAGAPDSEEEERELSVSFAAKMLLPALKNQARFKPAELMQAMDDSVHSRFIVAPSRTIGKRVVDGEEQSIKLRGGEAIASGLLGGFGGFLDRRFREADYALGQRNCLSFLERYFVVLDTNPLVAGHASNTKGGKPVSAKMAERGYVRILQFDRAEIPVIEGEFGARPPVFSRAALREVVELGRERLRVAANSAVKVSQLGSVERIGLALAWRDLRLPVFGVRLRKGLRTKLAEFLERTLRVALAERRQLSRFEDPEDDADRALYVGLLRMGGKPATPAEIAEKSSIIASPENFSTDPENDAPHRFALTPEETLERLRAGRVKVTRVKAYGLAPMAQRWRLA